jgi:ABC-type Fe3+-hydroxamate transport system substrate-binding protein
VNGKLTVKGGTKNPKIARIVELAPDLVFMNAEENRVEDARALEAAGIRVHSSMPVSPEDTAAMVRSIASAVGTVHAGETIAREIEQRAARVRVGAANRQRTRFAYLIWREPWMTVNGATFISTLLELPGGRNVFGDRTDRYPVVTSEEIRATHPDVLFLSSEPFPFTELHAEELATLTGRSRDDIVLCDGEMLSWHGSRTPRGIDYAEQLVRRVRRS